MFVFLTLGTRIFLFARSEIDHLPWRFERAGKRELSVTKSQEETRQRRCAMMISL